MTRDHRDRADLSGHVGDAAYHAALASRTRRRVLDAVAQAVDPVDALSIAIALGLHVTTVRFHLDQLEAAGLVGRVQGTDRRRGRPRIRYAVRADAAVRSDAAMRPRVDSREQLIDLLAGALAERDDGGRARALEAGRRWAEELARASPDIADAGDQRSDDGVDVLVRVLDDLGFEPRPVDGEQIRLHACPFRESAREHEQVICSVHRGLIEQLLERRGSTRHPKLLPFIEPDLCVITLTQA